MDDDYMMEKFRADAQHATHEELETWWVCNVASWYEFTMALRWEAVYQCFRVTTGSQQSRRQFASNDRQLSFMAGARYVTNYEWWEEYFQRIIAVTGERYIVV